MGSGAASCDRSSGKTVPVAEAATKKPIIVIQWTRQVSRVEKWMLDRQSGNELELKNMEAEYESKKRHLECTRLRDELELKTMEAACESKKQSLKSRRESDKTIVEMFTEMIAEATKKKGLKKPVTCTG